MINFGTISGPLINPASATSAILPSIITLVSRILASAPPLPEYLLPLSSTSLPLFTPRVRPKLKSKRKNATVTYGNTFSGMDNIPST